MQLLGAVPHDAGQVEFRAWAPSAGRVAVRLERGDHELTRSEGGTWEGHAPAGPGDDCRFVLDGGGGALPEPNPFQFFTDHVDPAIAEATREGRKREFESFAGFSGQVPGPQAEETFLRSKLSRREVPGMRDHYKTLLRHR